MTTFIICPQCGGEQECEVTVSAVGCGATRWSPAESPTFDVSGLGSCAHCSTDLDTSDNWTAAIANAHHDRTYGGAA